MENEFGNYLKRIRIKRGLSLRELARRSEVSQSYLSLVESGKRGIPTPEQLLKIAPHLKIDYLDLMKAAGYLMIDHELTGEEKQFLKDVEEGTPLSQLIKKFKPTIDEKEITLTELDFAINVIRNLRKTIGNG
jgi:transcriptional regulator with XRE-family HTH domain